MGRELLALRIGVAESLFAKLIYDELRITDYQSPVILLSDSRNCLCNTMGLKQPSEKNLVPDFEYLKSLIKEGRIILRFCPGWGNLSDCLTKAEANQYIIDKYITEKVLPYNLRKILDTEFQIT